MKTIYSLYKSTIVCICMFLSFGLYGQTSIEVNSLLDGTDAEVATWAGEGTVTLRYAVQSATNNTSNTITFSPTIANGSIVLSNGQISYLHADKTLTIDGEENNITIDGNNISRIFLFGESNEGNDASFSSITVRNLTLKNGNSAATTAEDSGGGAIRNFSKLTVENCRFSGNKASSSVNNNYIYGGAIFTGKIPPTDWKINRGLHVKSSIFQNNSINGRGGAIGASDSWIVDIMVENSVFIENSAIGEVYGGAIYSEWGSNATLVNNTFIRNSAGWGGGGYACSESNKVELGGNLFIGNIKTSDAVVEDVWMNGGGDFFTDLGYNISETAIVNGSGSKAWNAQSKVTTIPTQILTEDPEVKEAYTLTQNGDTETRIVPQAFINTHGLNKDIAGTNRSEKAFYNTGAKEYVLSTNIEEQQLVSGFYPNPVKNALYFDKSVEDKIELFDMRGAVLFSGSNIQKIDMSDFQSGIYLLKSGGNIIGKVIKVD